MARTVNLDALIPRMDMEAGEFANISQNPLMEMSHTDLEFVNSRYQILRKPDFQRPTSAWTPEKVCDLVVAYATGGLVPAIILWRSPNSALFVIDGAHRLSSLIAWIQNDYGDGERSKAFFEDIPKEQLVIADETRKLVEAAIGPWSKISVALSKNDPDYSDKARILANCKLTIQMLPTRDVIQAEQAFFKINEQGAPLSETDKIILHSRRCPNSLAARAIYQRGTGHPHWNKFGPPQQKQIEKHAKEIYTALFFPFSLPPSIRTPDVPIAGKYTQGTSLGFTLQVVNLANHVGDKIPETTEEAEALVAPDPKGNRTINFLRNTNQILTTIANTDETDYMRSLDLHPLVYFYSDRGNHLPLSFAAVVEWLSGWNNKEAFLRFSTYREEIEEFLIAHKDFFRQISRDKRGGIRAVHAIHQYFQHLLNNIESGLDGDALVSAIQASGFGYLKLENNEEEEEYGKDFSAPTKAQINISRHLSTALTCAVCNARVGNYGHSFDHRLEREKGGKGSPANYMPTHHYCNSIKRLLMPLIQRKKDERAKKQGI